MKHEISKRCLDQTSIAINHFIFWDVEVETRRHFPVASQIVRKIEGGAVSFTPDWNRRAIYWHIEHLLREKNEA